MSIVPIWMVPLLLALLFAGCRSDREPTWPLSGTLRFERVELTLVQDRLPTKGIEYATKEDVEERLNARIRENLINDGRLDPSSPERLEITVYLRRVSIGEWLDACEGGCGLFEYLFRKAFMGEGGLLGSNRDKFESIRVTHKIKLMRDDLEMREKDRLKIYKQRKYGDPYGIDQEREIVTEVADNITKDIRKFYCPKSFDHYHGRCRE